MLQSHQAKLKQWTKKKKNRPWEICHLKIAEFQKKWWKLNDWQPLKITCFVDIYEAKVPLFCCPYFLLFSVLSESAAFLLSKDRPLRNMFSLLFEKEDQKNRRESLQWDRLHNEMSLAYILKSIFCKNELIISL